MKTATQLKPSPATLPGGVKVTLYQGSINLWTAFIYALLFFAAPPVYCYVWEDLPSLNITHLLTGFWSSYLLSFRLGTWRGVFIHHRFLGLTQIFLEFRIVRFHP